MYLLLRVMRRFLRVRSSLVRCFPLNREPDADPHELVHEFLGQEDASGMSWRHKFDSFISFLSTRCGDEERGAVCSGGKGSGGHAPISPISFSLARRLAASSEARGRARKALIRGYKASYVWAKAAVFSASEPVTAAGSGRPQWADIGAPGQ